VAQVGAVRQLPSCNTLHIAKYLGIRSAFHHILPQTTEGLHYNIMYSSSSAVYDVIEVHKLCSSGQSLEHSAFAFILKMADVVSQPPSACTDRICLHSAYAQVFQWDPGVEPRCGLGQSPQKPDIFKQFAAVKMSILHPPTHPNRSC